MRNVIVVTKGVEDFRESGARVVALSGIGIMIVEPGGAIRR